MSKNCLIVNTGSASKKYSFYIGEEKKYGAHFEKEGESLIVTEIIDGKKEKKILADSDYPRSARMVIDSLVREKIIKSEKDLRVIGIRIVAPGDFFLETKKIDADYINKAEEALEKVPLHLAPALTEIKNLKSIFGESVPIVGVSDSAFHKTIPLKNKLYSIPISHTRKYEVYRFGYHGISIKSIVCQIKEKLSYIPEKMVVCHLGGGASISAVLNGESINNTMGFTPLEGLTMATRVGDIDPGVVLFLADKLNLNTSELNYYFNNKCGLLGLSGSSDDIRELLSKEKEGDKDAALALQVYVERVRENIAKMTANLGGIDMLVFAGTVGERSYILRDRICRDLAYMGIILDKRKNDLNEGNRLDLENDESQAKIMIIKTDEMAEIIKAVYEFDLN